MDECLSATFYLCIMHVIKYTRLSPFLAWESLEMRPRKLYYEHYLKLVVTVCNNGIFPCFNPLYLNDDYSYGQL